MQSTSVSGDPGAAGRTGGPEGEGSAFDKCLKLLYPLVNEEETPLPRRWSQEDKYHFLSLSDDHFRVHFIGDGRDYVGEASLVMTKNTIPEDCGIYYFEITVLCDSGDRVEVGLAAKGVDLNRCVNCSWIGLTRFTGKLYLNCISVSQAGDPEHLAIVEMDMSAELPLTDSGDQHFPQATPSAAGSTSGTMPASTPRTAHTSAGPFPTSRPTCVPPLGFALQAELSTPTLAKDHSYSTSRGTCCRASRQELSQR